ncbi:MAG: addiction module protein [Candidatus Omnitrophica bacterium]|nr:addiction module protein [Candidatus Omnitrophota bacterium]
MDQAIIEHEAMPLPAKERALLADASLGSLDDEAEREVEAAWTREAEEQLAAYRRADIEPLDGPSVLRELRKSRSNELSTPLGRPAGLG